MDILSLLPHAQRCRNLWVQESASYYAFHHPNDVWAVNSPASFGSYRQRSLKSRNAPGFLVKAFSTREGISKYQKKYYP
jgi:hypothetical protein